MNVIVAVVSKSSEFAATRLIVATSFACASVAILFGFVLRV